MIHNYKFGMYNKSYAEGYDRIFGKKAEDGKKINATRRRRQVQKARWKTKKARGQEPQGAGGLDRQKELRETPDGKVGCCRA